MDLWQLKQSRAFMERGKNRFVRMSGTYPELWKYRMCALGLKDALDYIGVPYSNTDKEAAQ